MKRSKPLCQTAPTFISFHCGKYSLGALTGQDTRALQAFAHLVELYAVSDTTGRHYAIQAMRATVQASQPSVWSLFKKCIPHVLDWSDEERLWLELEVPCDPSS